MSLLNVSVPSTSISLQKIPAEFKGHIVTGLPHVYNSTFPLRQGRGYGLPEIPPQTPQLSLLYGPGILCSRCTVRVVIRLLGFMKCYTCGHSAVHNSCMSPKRWWPAIAAFPRQAWHDWFWRPRLLPVIAQLPQLIHFSIRSRISLEIYNALSAL